MTSAKESKIVQGPLRPGYETVGLLSPDFEDTSSASTCKDLVAIKGNEVVQYDLKRILSLKKRSANGSSEKSTVKYDKADTGLAFLTHPITAITTPMEGHEKLMEKGQSSSNKSDVLIKKKYTGPDAVREIPLLPLKRQQVLSQKTVEQDPSGQDIPQPYPQANYPGLSKTLPTNQSENHPAPPDPKVDVHVIQPVKRTTKAHESDMTKTDSSDKISTKHLILPTLLPQPDLTEDPRKETDKFTPGHPHRTVRKESEVITSQGAVSNKDGSNHFDPLQSRHAVSEEGSVKEYGEATSNDAVKYTQDLRSREGYSPSKKLVELDILQNSSISDKRLAQTEGKRGSHLGDSGAKVYPATEEGDTRQSKEFDNVLVDGHTKASEAYKQFMPKEMEKQGKTSKKFPEDIRYQGESKRPSLQKLEGLQRQGTQIFTSKFVKQGDGKINRDTVQHLDSSSPRRSKSANVDSGILQTTAKARATGKTSNPNMRRGNSVQSIFKARYNLSSANPRKHIPLKDTKEQKEKSLRSPKLQRSTSVLSSTDLQAVMKRYANKRKIRQQTRLHRIGSGTTGKQHTGSKFLPRLSTTELSPTFATLHNPKDTKMAGSPGKVLSENTFATMKELSVIKQTNHRVSRLERKHSPGKPFGELVHTLDKGARAGSYKDKFEKIQRLKLSSSRNDKMAKKMSRQKQNSLDLTELGRKRRPSVSWEDEKTDNIDENDLKHEHVGGLQNCSSHLRSSNDSVRIQTMVSKPAHASSEMQSTGKGKLQQDMQDDQNFVNRSQEPLGERSVLHRRLSISNTERKQKNLRQLNRPMGTSPPSKRFPADSTIKADEKALVSYGENIYVKRPDDKMKMLVSKLSMTDLSTAAGQRLVNLSKAVAIAGRRKRREEKIRRRQEREEYERRMEAFRLEKQAWFIDKQAMDIDIRLSKSKSQKMTEDKQLKELARLREELKDKVIRDRLVAAVKRRNIDQIETAMKLFQQRGLVDEDGLVETAKQIIQVVKIKKVLEHAVQSRDGAMLSVVLEAIEEKGLIGYMMYERHRARAVLAGIERMRTLLHEVLELDISTVAEIRRYSLPPPAIHTVVCAMLLLLGQHEAVTKRWRNCQKYLVSIGQDGLMKKIQAFDVTSVHPEIAMRAKEILEEISLQDVKFVSPAACTLYVWTTGILEEVFYTQPEVACSSPAALDRQKEIFRVEKMKNVKPGLLSSTAQSPQRPMSLIGQYGSNTARSAKLPEIYQHRSLS